MPVKKEKKITKKPVKKPVKKTIKQKQSQRQSVVVNVHTGSSASKRKSSSKASGSSKVERVVPMPNYQASESPYPSYMRQSVAVPVEAGNPVFASVGQTVGPIQNKIPVFADTTKPPVNPPDEPVVQYPQQDVTVVTEKPVVTKKVRKSKNKPKPVIEPVVVSNVGIESESGIANIFTPMPPAGVKPPAGGAFSSIFPPTEKPSSPSGSFKLKPPPPLPKERTSKPRKGSRFDLEERYLLKTGNRWPQVPKRQQQNDLETLRQIVYDLEAGVAR